MEERKPYTSDHYKQGIRTAYTRSGQRVLVTILTTDTGKTFLGHGSVRLTWVGEDGRVSEKQESPQDLFLTKN